MGREATRHPHQGLRVCHRTAKARTKQAATATELAKELANVQLRIQLNMQQQAKIDEDIEQMEGA